jgi:RHS repeat-associated protein
MTTAAICATREVSWWPSFYRGASYGLDPVGNRMSANSTLPGINPIAGAYNADDEISSETYDANGNVIATGGKTYTYDSQNHMITANNGQVTMIYDGDGNRVSKTVGGVTTQYLVDDLNPTGYAQVVEEVVNGAVTRQYTYGLQRISQNLSPAVSGNSTWTPSFYVYDGGGSVRQLTKSNGTVTDEYEYDAYGNSFTKSGTTPNNYLYRGEQYDSDLGLYYLRARYYNPSTGRFLSRDPGKSGTTAPDATRNDLNSDAKQEVSFYLFGGPASTPVSSAPVSSATEGCLSSSLSDEDIRNPQAQHKYNYANSDPINRIDPSGRDSMIEFSLEDSEIEVEEEGVKAGRCAVVKNLCWSGCFLAVTSAGIHGADVFGDTRACTRRCMAAAGCFSY